MKEIRNKTYHLLRWGERYTKTDNVYLAKGGFWLTFAQAVSTLSSFGIAVAFANLVEPTTYGIYQFVLAMAGVLSSTTLSGLNTAAIRSVARGAEGVILESLKIKLKFGSVGSLLSLTIAGYYYFQSNLTLAICFFIVAFFLPLFYSLGISNALLKGKRLFSVDSKFNTASQIISAIAILITLLLTDNIFIIIALYFAVWTTLRFIIFRITIRKHKANDVVDPEMSSYGKHLSFLGFIGTVADFLDKILIFHFLGAVQVAIYSFAIAPVMQIKGMLKNVHLLSLPKFSKNTDAQVKSSLGLKSLITFLFSIPIAICYILLAPLLFKFLFPNYIESVLFSQIFTIAIPVAAFGTLSGSALEARLEIKRKYLISFFSKGLKIILMLVLIGNFGVWGIITAILTAQLLTVVLSFWLAKKT